MNKVIMVSSLLILVSCSDNSDMQRNPPSSPVTPGAVSSSAAPYAEFNTTITIRDVMNTFIDPSADAIWQAVRFEMDEAGSHEIFPQTEEEWEALRKHAISIIEGANMLMIPGRHVAFPGATTEFPAYEYLPEEVEQKLGEDRASWLVFAQGLQTATLNVLDAIAARDVVRLGESGGLVDQACESCHSQYWYRAESL